MHIQAFLALVGVVAALPQGAFVKPVLDARATPKPPPHPIPHTSTHSSSSSAIIAKRALDARATPHPPPPHPVPHTSTHSSSSSAIVAKRNYEDRLEEAYGGYERAVATPQPPHPPPTHPVPTHPPVTTHVSTHVVTKTVTATSHSSSTVLVPEDFGFRKAPRNVLSPVPPPPHPTTHVSTHVVTKTVTATSHSSSSTVLVPQDFGFRRVPRNVFTPVPPPPHTTHPSSSHSSISHSSLSHSSVSHSVSVHTVTTTVMADRAVAATPTSSGGAPPINTGALSLIEGLEGFQPNFYTIDGDETIGYGHDCTQRQDCSSIHPPISQAQGVALLKSDLPSYEKCVCALPNASGLNANQYGALVSFTYNSGCGGVQEYFTSQMSSKDYSGICSSLPTTNTNGGELSSRRQKEGAFCSQATTAASGC